MIIVKQNKKKKQKKKEWKSVFDNIYTHDGIYNRTIYRSK